MANHIHWLAWPSMQERLFSKDGVAYRPNYYNHLIMCLITLHLNYYCFHHKPGKEFFGSFFHLNKGNSF